MLFLIFLKIIAVLFASIIVSILTLISYYVLCVVKTTIFDKKPMMYGLGFHARKLGLPLNEKNKLYEESDEEYKQYVEGFEDAGKK